MEAFTLLIFKCSWNDRPKCGFWSVDFIMAAGNG